MKIWAYDNKSCAIIKLRRVTTRYKYIVQLVKCKLRVEHAKISPYGAVNPIIFGIPADSCIAKYHSGK